MNPVFGHRSCAAACRHAPVSVSRFAGEKIRTRFCLKCKSEGVGVGYGFFSTRKASPLPSCEALGAEEDGGDACGQRSLARSRGALAVPFRCLTLL